MESLRHRCGFGWLAPSPVWLGHVIGLNSLSLRYPTPGEEAGFLLHCSDRLRRVWFVIMVVYVLIYTCWLAFLMDVPDDEAHEAYSVNLIQYCVRLVCVLFALLHIAVVATPKLLRSMSAATRERAVMAMILWSQVTVIDKYYMAKICGYSDPLALYPDLEGYTDSLVLIYICTFLLVSHICLPIRWILLVTTELAAVALYATMAFVLGSPEPQSKILFAYLLCLVLLVAVGKRQSEVTERLVFSSLLAEKGLRMQAEFQLSQVAPPPSKIGRPAPDGDESSCAPTTATGEAFAGLDIRDKSESSLGTIWEVGKKEQWLIDERELVVNPHVCLGSGGFGVVVAGEFHGSPVALKIHIKTGTAMPLLDIGNELRLLRKLRHPNIVLLHGACISVSHSDLVLVMERIVGDSLLQFIGRQPAAAKRWEALMGVCHALMYLHSRQPPLSHGDLKPANIVVENRGSGIHAKLLDFGLARLCKRSARPGGGTYRWMAPGVLGPKATVQVEDDVFAFGLIMYFSSTGQKPFVGLTDDTLKKVACSSTNTYRALEWPAEACEFVLQCKSLAEPCVHQFREERPTMERVHTILSGFSETSSKSTDETRVDLSSSPNQSDFWSSLALARQIALHKPKKSKKKLPQLAKPLREPMAVAEVKPPAPPLEEDGGQNKSKDPSSTTRFPSLFPTPTDTMIASIFDVLMSWNSTNARECCCEYHRSVNVLSSLCTLLSDQNQDCTPLTMAGMHIYQCPACQALIPDDEGGLKKLHCQWCGYSGPLGLHVET